MLFPIDITQLDVYRTEKIKKSHYQAGSYVFQQGAIADFFYIIEEGEVEIVRENPDGTEIILAILNEGDSFGEKGLMEKAPRSASVRCLSAVELLKVDRHDFQTLSSTYTPIKDERREKLAQINEENTDLDPIDFSDKTAPSSSTNDSSPPEPAPSSDDPPLTEPSIDDSKTEPPIDDSLTETPIDDSSTESPIDDFQLNRILMIL